MTSISDPDADGLPALGDNCPLHPNPGQENADGDFIDVSPPRPPGLDDLTRAMSGLDGDACDTDDDNDGIADAAEAAGCNGSGPLDPLDSDTDGDRVLDGAECALGSNPASAASKPPPIVGPDADADGLPDALEPAGCAALFDCDGDGFRDGIEFRGYNTLPDVADSGGDGCADGREVASVDGNRVVGASDLGIIAALFGNPGGHENMDLDKNGAIGGRPGARGCPIRLLLASGDAACQEAATLRRPPIAAPC
ncbi:MAG TPA: hypothetical protein VNI78_01655 [Vicinamibacterales bacterium]|nr:hypothetical protein [Vicinamibacterales bacterium]